MGAGEITVSTFGWVEMRVEDAGEQILHYNFRSLDEASEMFAFLKEFFPQGTFLIQPLRH